MNPIEEKLWSYIDGSCTEDERAAISRLIASDEVYRLKYQELLAFERELSAMELDEPSMGFTYKVMESIRTEHAPADRIERREFELHLGRVTGGDAQSRARQKVQVGRSG